MGGGGRKGGSGDGEIGAAAAVQDVPMLRSESEVAWNERVGREEIEERV